VEAVVMILVIVQLFQGAGGHTSDCHLH